jgi:hypothetical protein
MKKFILAIALMAMGTTVSFTQNQGASKATDKTENHADHGAKGKKEKKPKKAKKADAIVAASYECPMKCEAASAKAGKCGKCGMDLVAVKPKSK